VDNRLGTTGKAGWKKPAKVSFFDSNLHGGETFSPRILENELEEGFHFLDLESAATSSSASTSVAQLQADISSHAHRIARLEDAVFVPHGREQQSAAPSTAPAAPPALISCPLDCGNSYGIDASKYHPRDLQRHARSRAHVEAALQLVPGTFERDLAFCACSGTAAAYVTVDLVECLGAQRIAELPKLFAAPDVATQRLCTNRPCLRLRRPSDGGADALIAARKSAAELLARLVFNVDGSRKRSRRRHSEDPDELRGDQAVAIEFAGAAPFSTPGVCYVVFDGDKNQLRVQQARPQADVFHVAHVARMHRWLEKVVHYAPARHRFWQTHVGVADTGFVDAFVVVHANVPLSAELDGDARRMLYENIACDEWQLCAGRSDGWLDLVRRADLATMPHLIALPLSHLQPHAVRLYRAEQRPSLMLVSDTAAAPLRAGDVRLQHYLPTHVSSRELKLELLAKCSGWHLVAKRESTVAALEAHQRDVAEHRDVAAAALERFDAQVESDAASKHAADAAAARQRMLTAMQDAEQLRRKNVALNRQLSDALSDAHRVADKRFASLSNENSQLKKQVQRLLDREAAARKSKAEAGRVEDHFAPAGMHSRKDVESWMTAQQDRRFVIYRRRNGADLALCTKLESGEMVHTRIVQHQQRFFFVCEMAADSIEDLIQQLSRQEEDR